MNALFRRPLRVWMHLGLLALGLWCLMAASGNAEAQENFLEPEQAFVLQATSLDERRVALDFTVAPGYYLYREAFRFEAAGVTLGPAQVPEGKVKFDENFQKNVETHRGNLRVVLPVEAAPARFDLQVTSQGCADAGLCYPPMTRVVAVSLAGFGGNGEVVVAGEQAPGAIPATGADEALAAASIDSATGGRGWLTGADDLAVRGVLERGSWWGVVAAFALMGLLLSFTPCVLPMLPILSSIIAGGGAVTRRRGLALAATYALGMSLVYTALGVAAGLAGEGLAGWLQKPWVLGLFAVLLLVFAAAMFDVFELRLPAAVATRLDGVSRRLPGGQWLGVFLMGGLSAAIVSPCVTAPLAGALLFLGQTRDVTLGGSALFAMAWGMSVPLLLLGASAGTWLPRSGAWMHAVKRFFGLLLIGVALWLVQPVLPAWLAMAAWGLLLLVSGFMLRPFDPDPHSHAPRVWLQRGIGVAVLAWGVMLLGGAASGGHDPLQPLKPLSNAGGAVDRGGPGGLVFRPVNSLVELDQALQEASQQGRVAMLDFYADWCVSCKEMERFTFVDPAVQARLQKAVLLKADVTANNADHRELLKRFQLFGPPGTLFFTPGADAAQAAVRVIGFQNANAFQKTLTDAGL